MSHTIRQLAVLLLVTITLTTLAHAQSMCNLFPEPPSTPVHLGTSWNGSRFIYQYQVHQPLLPPPIPTPTWWDPNSCELRIGGFGGNFYFHPFTASEFNAGGVTIVWNQPAWVTAACDINIPTLKCLPGASFYAQADPVHCAGQPCTLPSGVATFPSLIASQPTDLSTLPGVPATFQVSATLVQGAPTPTYQWERLNTQTNSWNSVGGATASTFSTAVAGRYRALIHFDPPVNWTWEYSSQVTLTTIAPQPFCFGDGTGAACPCGNSGAAGHGCANSIFAAGAVLEGSGVSSVAADTVTLSAQNLSGNVCVFFQGTASMAPAVIDDGIGCVGGTLIRLGTKAVNAQTASYPQGADLPISLKGAIAPPGGMRVYQAFYRNAAASFCPPATTNRTNGVQVFWGS